MFSESMISDTRSSNKGFLSTRTEPGTRRGKKQKSTCPRRADEPKPLLWLTINLVADDGWWAGIGLTELKRQLGPCPAV